MNTDSKESRIQVTWLTEDFQTVYEVVYGDRSSWKLLMTSKNVTTHESLQEVKEEKTVLSIPYTCTFLECEAYIAAPCHSLYCLIWEMVNESPNKRVHVEKICCQLAKLSRLYYEKPVWELSQEIRDEVDGRRKSLVKLEDDFCLIQSESSVGMNVNAVMSKDFGEKDSSKASCLQPKEGKCPAQHKHLSFPELHVKYSFYSPFLKLRRGFLSRDMCNVVSSKSTLAVCFFIYTLISLCLLKVLWEFSATFLF